MKAAVVLGPGATGSFAFEVGYEAVVDLINLFRRELHKNEGQRVTWMSEEAADLASRLNLLGAVGLDVDMMYLMGVDVVMSLYEALMSGGRGGAIAHTIMTYDKPAELEEWFVNATTAALGPILMTLSTNPEPFQVTDTGKSGESLPAKKYDQREAYVLQQRAIDTVLSWILENAKAADKLAEAQNQFATACMSMNKFGVTPKEMGQAYCEHKYTLDNFMSVEVNKFENRAGVIARSRYKKTAAILGKNLDSSCQIIPRYNAFTPLPLIKYAPAGIN
jgi:hypothetical protein